MIACVALGGTISGEHGIGVEKIEAMRLVFSDDDIDAQRSLQAAFDPNRVLNPGKMFPDTPAAVCVREARDLGHGRLGADRCGTRHGCDRETGY